MKNCFAIWNMKYIIRLWFTDAKGEMGTNRRLKDELGLRLRYPTVVEGLRDG